jgi:hypothetical protein
VRKQAELDKASLHSTGPALDGDMLDANFDIGEIENGVDAVDAMHVVGDVVNLKTVVIAPSK